jgi:hypothetical protein
MLRHAKLLNSTGKRKRRKFEVVPYQEVSRHQGHNKTPVFSAVSWLEVYRGTVELPEERI